jgi:hypothetical protein
MLFVSSFMKFDQSVCTCTGIYISGSIKQTLVACSRNPFFMDRDSSFGIATGLTVRGSNPGGGEIFRTRPDRPWSPPSLLYNGYQVFPGGKADGA